MKILRIWYNVLQVAGLTGRDVLLVLVFTFATLFPMAGANWFGTEVGWVFIVKTYAASIFMVFSLILLLRRIKNQTNGRRLWAAAFVSLNEKLCNAADTGVLIDTFIPPEDAEHRAESLSHAHARWAQKYGKREADRLHLVHSITTICLFWFDRVASRLSPVRKSKLD